MTNKKEEKSSYKILHKCDSVICRKYNNKKITVPNVDCDICGESGANIYRNYSGSEFINLCPACSKTGDPSEDGFYELDFKEFINEDAENQSDSTYLCDDIDNEIYHFIYHALEYASDGVSNKYDKNKYSSCESCNRKLPFTYLYNHVSCVSVGTGDVFCWCPECANLRKNFVKTNY